MNPRDIVISFLEENGYSGLFYPGECSCFIDDLMYCETPADCEPGYECTDQKCGKFESCADIVICRYSQSKCKFHNQERES